MSHLAFFDTEFTDFGIDTQLISIGFVTEGGQRAFYAKLSDSYREGDCSDFAREVVLPLLEGGACRMTMDELRIHLTEWFDECNHPIKHATDSLSWDLPWVQKLFSQSNAWPINVETAPIALELNEEFYEAVENTFSKGMRLDDAKANRILEKHGK